MQLRPYQSASIHALYAWFRINSGNPLLVLPTGAGKSVIIAEFVRDVMTQFPGQRILMLTHVKELIEQNYQKLMSLWPEAPAGIYSASLNRRDTWDSIIYAGIQSTHNKAMQLGRFNLVIIDECHLVNVGQEGTYRKLIDELRKINPSLKVIGLTATNFRTTTGDITYGDDAIFNGIAHEVTIKELLDGGYLAPLVSKKMAAEVDVSGLHIKAGEFVQKELEAAFDRREVTNAALNEVMQYSQGRKGWLVFCSGVEHAQNVCQAMRARGIDTACVTGSTSKVERERIIEKFKAGKLTAITNANVLTTGFDAPHTDLLIFLRATQSPGLCVQMMGRGMRLADGKENCLVLDFGGNVSRHGPVDKVKAWRPTKYKKTHSAAPTRVCEKCQAIVAAQLRVCVCGYEFPIEHKDPHGRTAYDGDIISGGETSFIKTYDVSHVYYRAHDKGGNKSMRVDYHNGILNLVASEWVLIEYAGIARAKAVAWWAARSSSPCPRTVEEALERKIEIKTPIRIRVNEKGKYAEIVGYDFDNDTKREEGSVISDRACTENYRVAAS